MKIIVSMAIIFMLCSVRQYPSIPSSATHINIQDKSHAYSWFDPKKPQNKYHHTDLPDSIKTKADSRNNSQKNWLSCQVFESFKRTSRCFVLLESRTSQLSVACQSGRPSNPTTRAYGQSSTKLKTRIFFLICQFQNQLGILGVKENLQSLFLTSLLIRAR